ncbi:MAG: hypothetical protein QM729_10850 [Solirubrobacterales bacterium]
MLIQQESNKTDIRIDDTSEVRSPIIMVVIVTAFALLLCAAWSASASAEVRASTGQATDLTGHAATLTGSFTPAYPEMTASKGQIVAGFEYGLTTEYGQETIGEVYNNVSGQQAVSTRISGLEPETTYHYRLVVMGEGELLYAADGTFTTTANLQVWFTALVSKFMAGYYPASVKATQAPEDPVWMTINSRNARCSSLSMTGYMQKGAHALELTPTYEGCEGFGLSASVSPNSCGYSLTNNSTFYPAVGSLAITCPESAEGIEIDASGVCTVMLPPQEASGEVSLLDVGEGPTAEVEATLDGATLEATVTGSKLICGTSGTREVHLYGTLLLGAKEA